ncbi:MAG: ATP-binding protein [Gemmatimonadota bacterium]
MGAPSLRFALFLRTILPLFVVLGGATVLALLALEREVEERMQEDVELVARGLRLPVTHALELEREGAVGQALQSALGIRRLYGAHVYGAEGARLASFGAGLGDEDPGRLGEVLEAGEQVGEYGRTAGAEIYSFFVPLTDSWGRNLGVLQITRLRSDIDGTIQRLRFQAAGFLALGLSLVAILVLHGHHRAVGGPLSSLTGSMARVRAGDRDHRAPVRGPRELAEVSATFNSMLEAMQDTEKELEERREAQSRLRRELAEAEKLAALGELAGGVAHELGSPLSVIDGNAQRLLRKGELEGDAEAAIQGVRAEVRRMEGIIRQLLEFGRRDSGRRRALRVAAAIRRSVDSAAAEARRNGATIEVVPGPPGAVVQADPRRFEEVLGNLLRNACQAVGSDEAAGRIRIGHHLGSAPSKGADGERQLIIDIEDDGPGIEPAIASRIFEPFFTTKGTGEGTGLGLAVVHGVLEGMGGEILVGRSDLGGARFRIRLLGVPYEGDGGATETTTYDHPAETLGERV